MNKNILIIGGTYFAGRIFSLLAESEGNRVTVINRGNYSMNGTGIRQIRCDRRDEAGLRALALDPKYDAVVDFCAYEPGDIKRIIDHLPCDFEQYIYVSTPDVTMPSPGVRDENSPVLNVEPADEVGQYTWKKLLLEGELKDCLLGRGTGYTIIRPAFVFGPFNYAPRESWYIENIIRNGEVLHPVDATGKFNMVYVKDLAKAMIACVYDGRARNRTYVVSAPEIMDYDSFLGALREVSDREFAAVPVRVQDVVSQNIPLPFPLTERENELFDGSRICRELGFAYTGFKENLKKTYVAFAEEIQIRLAQEGRR